MKPDLTVSVVTPSFQQGRFIGQTIESVRDQSYPPIEHIVQDGGSTDETLDVLRKAGPTVRWVSEPDTGQTNALNRAIAKSRGDIVAWLNSDDLLYPGAIERAVEEFGRTNADAIYGACALVDESRRTIGRYHTEPFSYAMLLNRNIIAQPALLFRRTLYERFGPFDESLKFAMDYEYWLRCGREAKIVYITDLLAAYRIHLGGKTTRGARAHAAEANRVRWHYGRGVLPGWRLSLISVRTSLGGIAKSVPAGISIVRALKWQRQ
jgi:glycosyltransferase involved in cell wall biosynthesis